ncbi:MAG: hypothetical protein R3Y35_00305 [Clostridia bacterium]
MKKHYDNILESELLDLFPSEHFRLVMTEDRKVPCGVSEIPVIIDMKKQFAKSLSFKTPWDCELFGFVKCKNTLFKKTGYANTVKITMSDWDDNFTLIFEDEDGNESPIYNMDKEYVKTLLEECIKPKKLS